MTPESRRSILWLVLVITLVLASLLVRRVFYAVELAALELRYLWWLFLILLAGGWLASLAGRNGDKK